MRRLSMLRSNATVKALAIFSAFTIVYCWKILLTNQFTLLGWLDEGVNQTYVWLYFFLDSVRLGHLPIWDPFSYSGNVYVGEMQTGIFYPGKLLLALLAFGRADPHANNAYHIYYALAHILACLTMYRFVRELGLSFFAGIIAGLAFSFGGITGNVAPWPHQFDSATWIPMVMMFAWRSLNAEETNRRMLNAAISGLFVALSLLGGGLYVVIVEAAAVVGLVAIYGAPWQLASGVKRLVGRAMPAIVVLSVGVIGGAAQLLPSAEYGARAYRWLGAPVVLADQRIPYAYIKDGAAPYHPVSFLIPYAFTGKWGAGEVLQSYLGVLIVILAGIGVWKCWDKFWVRYSVILGIVAYLFSLTSYTPVHGFLYAVVPYISMAREGARFLYLVDFAAIVLAAYGVERLLSPAYERSSLDEAQRIIKWLSLASIVCLTVFAVSKLDLNSWVAWSLTILSVTYVLFRYVLANRERTSTKFLLVAFILVDLYSFDWQPGNLIEYRSKNIDYIAKIETYRGAANFLKKQPGPFRVRLDIESPSNIGPVLNVETLNGRGATMLRTYLPLIGRADLMNARYFIKPASATEANPVYHDASFKVYENPNAYPRAWLVHQTKVVSWNDSFSELDNPTSKPRDVALLVNPIEALDTNADRSSDKVEFSNYDPRHPNVTVQTAGRAMVVFSEVYYPGWKAAVNGVDQPIIRTDGGLRGVIVPGGRSEVVMRYRPTSIIVGFILSALTFLAVGYWAFVAGMKSRVPSAFRRGGEPAVV